jgi:hypothetical protein
MFAVFTGFGPVFSDSENAGTGPGSGCLDSAKKPGPDRTFKHYSHLYSNITPTPVQIQIPHTTHSLFNTILHVQVHRHWRVLRRLGDKEIFVVPPFSTYLFHWSTLVDIFVPLVGNYVMSISSVDHRERRNPSHRKMLNIFHGGHIM